MARIRGVLLDIDGTLLDSNDAHARAWVDALGEAGKPRRYLEVRPLIGMGSDRLVPALTGLSPESEAYERLVARRRQIFLQRYLPGVPAVRQVRPLLDRMRREGLKLVVATSAADEELEPLLERAGVADLLDERTSSSDAEQSKPAPDIVEAAVERSRFRPDELVMLGDTPYDVLAARRAGVPIVAVRSGGWNDVELRGAVAIYDDVGELFEKYDHSVFGTHGVGTGQYVASSCRNAT